MINDEQIHFGWVTRLLTHEDEDGNSYWLAWNFTESSDPNPPAWSRGSYRAQEAVKVFIHQDHKALTFI